MCHNIFTIILIYLEFLLNRYYFIKSLSKYKKPCYSKFFNPKKKKYILNIKFWLPNKLLINSFYNSKKNHIPKLGQLYKHD